MSYYIRYVLTDDKMVTLPELEQGLIAVNPAFEIDGDTVIFEDGDYGLIEINAIGDGIFEDDIELLKGFAEEKENKDILLALLQNGKSMVTIRPVWEDRDDDSTLEALAPVWQWLYTNRSGLLVYEGGDFVNESGGIIE